MATSKRTIPDRQTLLAKWLFFASSIPIHPRILLITAEKVRDRYLGADELESVITLDPALCLRVMRMAGSSPFREIALHTPRQAIMRIGFDRITQMVNQVFYRKNRMLSYSSTYLDMFDDLWVHSVITSLAAVELQKRAGGATPERQARARYLGLIHDLGRLIFLTGDHDRHSRIVRGAVRGHLGNPSREFKEFHLSHEDVGGEVAIKWNLGWEISWVMAAHHVPARAPREYGAVPLIHLADWVALKVQEDWIPDMKEPDRQAARALGLSPSDLRLSISATQREWERVQGHIESVTNQL